MSPPAHQDLPANEMELIDRGTDARAAELTMKFRSMQRFCAAVNGWGPKECHRWHHWSVPCDQAHRFPFHRNVKRFLPKMGGEVYVEGCAEPMRGAVPTPRFVELIQMRDSNGLRSQPDKLWLDCKSGSAWGPDGAVWSQLCPSK